MLTFCQSKQTCFDIRGETLREINTLPLFESFDPIPLRWLTSLDNLFSSSVQEEDPYSRIKSVTRWYIAGFYKKPKVAYFGRYSIALLKERRENRTCNTKKKRFSLVQPECCVVAGFKEAVQSHHW